MKAWLKTAIAGLAACSAPLAAQGLATVGEKALAPAARACIGLSPGLDSLREQLKAQGWSRGSMEAGGKQVASDLEFYGREGVLLILNGDGEKPGCIAIARVKSSVRTERLLEIVSAALGRQPTSRSGNQAMWILDQGQALLVQHGRGEEGPVVRIVTTSSEQKKN
jgi:hypothetical protein